MAKFRKKPVVIDAVRWQGSSDDYLAIMKLATDSPCAPYFGEGLRIKTLEGTMRADIGDWIIRGVKGELYPCKNNIFEATYELLGESSEPDESKS